MAEDFSLVFPRKHKKFLFSDIGKKCFLVLYFFISLSLYFFAPYRYSVCFIGFVFVLYIIDVLTYFSLKKTRNYFTFDFIFSVSFTFVYFVYPLFIFPINKTLFFMFNYGFNENVINKATALALVGYSAFILGLLGKKENSRSTRIVHFKPIPMVVPNIIVAVFVFLHFVKIVTMPSIYSEDGNADPTANGGIWGYIAILQNSSIVAALSLEFYNQFHKVSVKKWYKNNSILFALVFVDILLTFSTGSRGWALQYILIILAGISILNNGFSLKRILLLIFFGMVLMSFIVVVRSRGAFQFSFNMLNMAMDLIINNYTLYLGYDFVQNNGCVLFTLIGSLLSAIPMLSGLIINTFGISIYETSSARYFSLLALGKDTSFGVGTNIIGALYLAGGLVAVIVFMFLLGGIISWLSTNLKKSSAYKLVLYFTMVGFSVYLARADYFYPVGKIVFELFFIVLFVSSFIWKQKSALYKKK